MLINLLLSTDTDRFSLHFLLAALLLLVFFSKENNTAFSEGYDEAILKVKNNKAILAIAGISIILIVFMGVRF